MKALILDGTVDENNTIEIAYRLLVEELTGLGWETDTRVAKDMKVAYCAGCFGCWVKTPGVCLVDDAARGVAEAAMESDLLIFLTPITFGGYSSELKKLADRLIPLISPFFMKVHGEIHHRPRYKRYPNLLGIGVLPRPDEDSEMIFDSLVTRNAINLHCNAFASGIITPGRPDLMRDTLKALLRRVGVSR